jgi:hypothetical protein
MQQGSRDWMGGPSEDMLILAMLTHSRPPGRDRKASRPHSGLGSEDRPGGTHGKQRQSPEGKCEINLVAGQESDSRSRRTKRQLRANGQHL